MLLFIIIGVGLIFGLMGFTITDKNAKYWLSGYNTMKPEEQAKFPLTAYLKKFKKFHLFLGATIILGGLTFYFTMPKDWVMMFLVLYPITAYIFFVASNLVNVSIGQRKTMRFAILILIICLIGISVLFLISRRENPIKFTAESINIEGIYGQNIPFSKVDSVYILTEIPPIKSKLNGFAISEIKKGEFILEDGSKARLILNSTDSDILLITLKDAFPVYYSSSEHNEFELALELRSRID